MTVALSSSPMFQGIGPNGIVVGGQLFTYIAGSSTPQASYVDSTQTVQNTNPVILNSNGQANVWLVNGQTYKLVLQDAAGNQIWAVDNVTGGLALTQALIVSLLYPQTAAELAAGVTPVSFAYWAQPWLWVRREGCVLDGVTDDTAAFNKCLAVAAATNMGLLIDGPMFINSASIVIPQNVQLWFVGNGKLKPGSGKTITLGQTPVAGLWQIFDLSSGGLIAIPGTGNRISEVWAEWWGANGDAVSSLANDVPINAALVCLNSSSGGVVRIGMGTFFTSAVINIFHETRIEGINGFTLIKAKVGWTGGTQMFNASRAGNLAMFWSRISNVRIDANALNAITQVVYARGWQEKCGLFNVQITNFIYDGFYYEHGDGGAAHMQLNNVELFPNDIANARGAYITNDATAGYLKLEINQLTVASQTATQNTTGIQLDNHILCCANGIDIETIRQGITLSNSTGVGVGSILTGAGMSGGSNVTTMVNCAGNWTGQIDFAGAKIGNATALLTDSNRAYAMAAVETIDGHLTWPPCATRVVASAVITGSATPVVAYGNGISAVAHQAAGQQRLTLGTSMDGTSTYDVLCSSADGGAPIIWASKVSATQFDIFTKTGANVAADAGEFTVKVFHKP